ncbi:hypothetical protein IAU60_003989 [Kwoniella sp. DSM 27419]
MKLLSVLSLVLASLEASQACTQRAEPRRELHLAVELGGVSSARIAGPSALIVAPDALRTSETPFSTGQAGSGSTRVLQRRADAADNVTIPLPPSTPPTRPPRSAPTPFDLSISHALSSGCMIYLASLLSDPTFLSCLPFSLLLTTSSGYSSLLSSTLTTGNYTSLNNLIAYTSSPQPSADACTAYMSDVLADSGAKSNCGTDMGKVPVAKEAKIGIGNYAMMREAEGLVDYSTGRYCYLEALASGRPDDLYLWGLASGISLPPTSTPTCSPCSRVLLNTYTKYIPTTPTLNATSINAAIHRVNTACGQGFVNLSTSTSGGTKRIGGHASPNVGGFMPLAALTAGLIWTLS